MELLGVLPGHWGSLLLGFGFGAGLAGVGCYESGGLELKGAGIRARRGQSFGGEVVPGVDRDLLVTRDFTCGPGMRMGVLLLELDFGFAWP
jgi:hypothetical protein